MTAENSEFIAVCAGSITDISEEEVVLLTERYFNQYIYKKTLIVSSTNRPYSIFLFLQIASMEKRK